MNKPALAIAALFLCAGCAGLLHESWGGGAGSCTNSTDQGTIYNGISHLTHDGRPYFVLITAGGGGGSVSGGPPGSGEVTTKEGRRVEWSCDTRDGLIGKVAIGGQKFRLQDGGVFLLDLRDGQMVIEQAAVEMSKLEGGFVENRLDALATTDERVARFLAVSKSPK